MESFLFIGPDAAILMRIFAEIAKVYPQEFHRHETNQGNRVRHQICALAVEADLAIRAALMSKRAAKPLKPRDIQGLKYRDRLLPSLDELHEVGCRRDKADNRCLH
jgi:hypothetical protein